MRFLKHTFSQIKKNYFLYQSTSYNTSNLTECCRSCYEKCIVESINEKDRDIPSEIIIAYNEFNTLEKMRKTHSYKS